jgi:hypothetical protein
MVARLAGFVYLASATAHAQWLLGGPSTPVVAGSLNLLATLRNGDLVGISILCALVLGVVGGVMTLLRWSYFFSLSCLGVTLMYFFLLAPLGLPYLPFLLADVVALTLVVMGRHQFLDNVPPAGPILPRRSP